MVGKAAAAADFGTGDVKQLADVFAPGQGVGADPLFIGGLADRAKDLRGVRSWSGPGGLVNSNHGRPFLERCVISRVVRSHRYPGKISDNL